MATARKTCPSVPSHRKRRLSSFSRRLQIESLESRQLLTAFSVTNLNDAGPGSLREAIVMANANSEVDTIQFEVTGTIEIASELRISKGLTITGPGADLLTIDAGHGSDDTFNTGDGYRIFRIYDGTFSRINVSLSGLTLTGGDGVDFTSGGAIHNSEHLTIADSTITDNSASSLGGGIFNSGITNISNSTINENWSSTGGGIASYGALNVESSTINNNQADQSGGGIHYRGPNTGRTVSSITNSTINENSARLNGGGIFIQGGSDNVTNITDSTMRTNSARRGGGIYNEDGTANVTGGMISNNSVEQTGGGAHNENGITNVTNLTLSFNSASGGGGIFNNEGTANFTNSTIKFNSANSGGGVYNDEGTANFTNNSIFENRANVGGGIYSDGGTAEVIRSTLNDNFATLGGAIFMSEGTADVVNSTISDNGASFGGAIFNTGTANVTSSTITANLASFDGGAIYNTGTMPLDSTIVSGNSVDDSPNNLSGDGIYSGNFNLLGSGTQTSGTNDIMTDSPLLGPLTNNGGPTSTRALLEGSQAIDAGVGSVNQTDQRGEPFVRFAGDQVDIGAYEIQTLAASNFMVTTAVDELDFSNANISLREAIHAANGGIGGATITFGSLFSTEQTIRIDSQLPTITKGITIVGPASALLTIDGGNGSDDTFNTRDGYRILHIDDGNLSNEIDVRLSRITLTGGDPSVNAFGGAIYNSESLTLNNLVINRNSANSGGGIYNEFGTVTVNNSRITNNFAERDGGGVGDFEGTWNINNSFINGNSAGSDGGGIHTIYGTLNISGGRITGNSAGSDGGGISSMGGMLNENDTIISGNTVGGTQLLPCDLVGAIGCDEADIDALYAEINGVSGPLADAMIIQWLADASDAANPLKPSSTTTYVMGDTNLDGRVDSADLGLLLQNFGDASGLGWAAGNLNSDTQVDSDDLGLLLNNFGFDSTAAASSASADPLPAIDNSLTGDVNEDGRISPIDALQIINAINSGEPSSIAMDLSRDGIVASTDALFVINRLKSTSTATDIVNVVLDEDEEEE